MNSPRFLSGLFFILLASSLTLRAEEPKPWDDDLSAIRDDVTSLTSRLRSNIDMHGFISQGFFRSSDNNYIGRSDTGSWDYTEYGINLRRALADNLTIGLQFFAREMGGLSTEGVIIDWAFADYTYADWLGFRAGRITTPLLGMYNDTRDIDTVRVPILLPQSLYQERRRETNFGVNGIEFYGNIDIASLGTLDYETWIGGTKSKVSDSLSKTLSESGRIQFETGEADHVAGLGLSWNTPLEGVRFTGTLASFNDLLFEGKTTAEFTGLGAGYAVDSKFNSLDFYVAGIEFEVGDLILSSEYHIMRGKLYNTIFNTPAGNLTSDYLVEQEAYYLMLTYQLNQKLSLGTYYSIFYRDKDDKDDDASGQIAAGRITEDFQGWQKDLAFSMKYDFTSNWSAKAELHFIDGAAHVASVDNPGGMSEHWRLLLFKLTYSF